MKSYQPVLLLFVLMCICACKPDQAPAPDITAIASFSPTPYPLHIPVWFDRALLPPMPIPPDNPLTVEGVALGRKLFYDKRLSIDNSQSCGSCHQQKFGFADPNPFSKGVDGSLGDRNAMAIINLGWSHTLFWDGRRTTLEDQAHDPVVNPIEMKSNWDTVVRRLTNDSQYPVLFQKAFGTAKIDSNLVTKAIAQFERTLISLNSRYDKYIFGNDSNALNESEKRGKDIFFRKAGCAHCHLTVLTTDDSLRNNGLDAVFRDKGLGQVTGHAGDNGKFKVTTLRNIAQTAPYMHDARFKTLEEVVFHYSNRIVRSSPNLDKLLVFSTDRGPLLTPEEQADLVAFLKTLTDDQFLNNPAFAAPAE
jgi:cytochrome c peroxidase